MNLMILAKNTQTFGIDMEKIIEVIEESVNKDVPLSSLKSNLEFRV